MIPDSQKDSTAEALRHDFLHNLFYRLGRFPEVATVNDHYLALAYAVRDRLVHRWLATIQTYFRSASRSVCYLSAEYLLGPHLGNALANLGMTREAARAMSELGHDLDRLLEQEVEPGLGNGGLGRLAACYLDSLATLKLPAIGYGIRYEFGIFEQEIVNEQQVERTDKWLRLENPWEIARPEIAYPVRLGGHTAHETDAKGRLRVRWVPGRVVMGTPFDTPILGYGVPTANLLRLWKAEAPERFEFGAFNAGDYYGAVDRNVFAENLTKVLYPNDEPVAGKQLRLEQQYFFVSCSLQDMIRIHLQVRPTLDTFHEKYAVQLNDTHPSIGVAELMRLLVDEHDMDWDRAWSITGQTFAYTNHTLLPEALETWPLPLFERVLPRHLEIIYEINRRFLDEVRRRRPGDDAHLRRVSLIDERGDRAVRMANLACVGSHAINGVAELHSDLLKSTVLADFAAAMPEKFTNVTNGVTPRRFLLLANPRLSDLITGAIGSGWVTRLSELSALAPLAEDAAFRARWRQVKLACKTDLAAQIRSTLGIEVDPTSLFDAQAKRIHEYKRQHLNLLHVITRYLQAKRDPARVQARTWVFGGKAAPGYFLAKRIIHLVHAVARVVNGDPAVAGKLKVAFLPNFNVKSSRHIYTGADLSEQISTAGKEASGTGNMKFSLNGALTIGTLDGANIEIRREVGAENFFLFGMDAAQVAARTAAGYRPREIYEADPELKEVIDLIASGAFAGGDASVFRPVVDSLLGADPFLVLADYRAYVDCQDTVNRAYADPERWTRMSILNVAHMGRFSSDRAIAEYAARIWKLSPVEVDLDPDHDGWPGWSAGPTSRTSS